MNNSMNNKRYAELLLRQHINKIQFILNNFSFDADVVAATMTAILNTYGELDKVHTQLLIDEVTKDVAAQFTKLHKAE